MLIKIIKSTARIYLLPAIVIQKPFWMAEKGFYIDIYFINFVLSFDFTQNKIC